jgi:NAD(P)-dependent dehydrogenase (short-subunit alcohol dehydrogenase family)
VNTIASATPRQRALVRGASNGIGLELASVLARKGYSLVITARNQGALEGVARGLSAAYGVPVHPVAADLALRDELYGKSSEWISAGEHRENKARAIPPQASRNSRGKHVRGKGPPASGP